MISFIVIGRNESKTITKCLTSIFKTIEYNNFKETEVIYVDSDSTDDTINMVKTFDKVKVYQLKNYYNAAIARNVGAEKSKGDVLFFVDGDMELLPKMINILFDNGKLISDFVSGNFINYYYNNNDEFIGKEIYHKIDNDTWQTTTGGLFAIKKDLWNDVGGMKNKYKKSQDLDLGLRLAKKGIKLLRKADIICIHHTVSYYEEKRLWSDLFSGNHLYNKSVLYRDHLYNPFIYKYLKREVSIGFLSLSIFFSVVFSNVGFYGLYFFIVFVKVFYKEKTNKLIKSRLSAFFYYSILDHLVLFGFFFFWPSNKKKFEVKTIKGE